MNVQCTFHRVKNRERAREQKPQLARRALAAARQLRWRRLQHQKPAPLRFPAGVPYRWLVTQQVSLAEEAATAASHLTYHHGVPPPPPSLPCFQTHTFS
jgi:hypothetical protein